MRLTINFVITLNLSKTKRNPIDWLD